MDLVYRLQSPRDLTEHELIWICHFLVLFLLRGGLWHVTRHYCCLQGLLMSLPSATMGFHPSTNHIWLCFVFLQSARLNQTIVRQPKQIFTGNFHSFQCWWDVIQAIPKWMKFIKGGLLICSFLWSSVLLSFRGNFNMKLCASWAPNLLSVWYVMTCFQVQFQGYKNANRFISHLLQMETICLWVYWRVNCPYGLVDFTHFSFICSRSYFPPKARWKKKSN